LYGAVSLKPPNQQQVKNYICCENGESFMVGITTANKQDSTTYGTVLYLDGKRVPGKKTFRGRCLFQGFKLGGGKFRYFDFNLSTGMPGEERVIDPPMMKDPLEAKL
jgi:hypothetical protein